jgi:dTDP-glucose 4,6-dehydratase
MQKERILITGALGFIFSHVSEYLSTTYDVTIIDNCSDGSNPELLDTPEWKNINFLQYNINKIDSLDSEIRLDFDYIIHAAAESNVDKSIVGNDIFIDTNIIGTKEMLDFARKCKNLKRFIYVSTDEVYGSSEEHLTPLEAIMPANPYSASKAAGGHLTWAYNNTYELPVHEIRMCNIIGRRQANTKLIPKTIENINTEQEIPIYDGGLFTREYMDVRQVGPILKRILEFYEDPGIFNLTYNQELSIYEVIGKISTIMGKRYSTTSSNRKGHDKHYRMVPHPIMDNFEMIPFDETVKWMLE